MKKIWMTICTLTLGLALLSGCGQQTTTAEPIGIDAAKTLALEDAGISADAASFTTAGLDRRGDTEYYEVDFTANGETYEYEIDAITGVIIEKQIPGGQTATDDTAQTAGTTTVTQSGTQTSGDVIGEEAARKAALDHAGLAESEVTFIRSHLDWDDGRQVYDVEFYTSDYTEYDYEIDAATGEILSYDFDAEYYGGGSTASSGTAITEAEANDEVADVHEEKDAVVVKSALQKLFSDVAPRYKDRNGGYTRILKLAVPRKGDAAPMVILELV